MGDLDDASTLLYAASDQLETISLPLQQAVETICFVQAKVAQVSSTGMGGIQARLARLVNEIQSAERSALDLSVAMDDRAAELDGGA